MKRKRAVIDVMIIITVITAIICICISFKGFREEYRVKKSCAVISDEVRSTDEDGEDFIDFEKLKKINPGITAWICIPATPVDYPIVKAKDNNDYYLNHDVKGTYSQYGAIFTDFRLYRSPFKEKNCIIYGHNMGRWSDVMFSSLMNYEKQSYYDRHKSVYIYMEESGRTEYRIVSVRKVDYSDYAYTITFGNKKTFAEWIIRGIEESIIRCDVEGITTYDRAVTLSTCTYASDKLAVVCVPTK